MPKKGPFAFPKEKRLLRREQFSRVSRQGATLVGRYLVIEWLERSQPGASLGITASKRYGKSHDRNLFKRRVREAFRLLSPSLPLACDLIVKPRAHAKQATFVELQSEMKRQLISLTSRQEQKG